MALWVKNFLSKKNNYFDSIFSRIDEFSKGWTDNYVEQIKLVNNVYKRGGKLDDLGIEECLEKLLSRYDYLLYKNYFKSSIKNIAISVLSTIVMNFITYQTTDNKITGILLTVSLVLVAVIAILNILIIGINKNDVVTNLEIELLKSKLQFVILKIGVSEYEAEKILKKQIIINCLSKEKLKIKSKETKLLLENGIKRIERMDNLDMQVISIYIDLLNDKNELKKLMAAYNIEFEDIEHDVND